MARTTRGDSNRDTVVRQTSRRPSTDSTTKRGVEAGQASQSSTTKPGNQASQPGAPDRERSIETRNETRNETPGAQAENAGAGVSRRQATSPVYGSSGAGMNPFAAMRRWSEDMDRLLQDFGFGQLGFGSSPFREIGSIGRRLGPENEIGDWSPQVEAFRRGDKFVVRADLPGMKKDDVKVEVENNVLTISGERTDEHEENREGFYRSESSYGQFFRAIPLPDGVNAEQCDATFKDGVLEVALKAPQQREKSRQIPIR